MSRASRVRAALVGGAIMTLVACGSAVDGDDGAGTEAAPSGEGGEAPPELLEVEAGFVSAVDQIGAAVALDAGFYDEGGLDVNLARPFPTGVESLNALQSGDVDFIQVGTPTIGAVLDGIDLVYLGSYTGSSSQRGIDETMAMVATEESGIDGDDLSTLAGKRFGVSIGSISHLYLLGVLQEAGIAGEDVKLVNTAPPDMGVALETGGLDAAVVWDPWPITIAQQVDGTIEVLRGGGYVPFVGYIVAMRDFVEANPDVVEAFLTARAATDAWMRENTDAAAATVTRWLPGTEIEVAEEAMQHNVQQLDPRFSACNYLALDTLMNLLAEQGAVEGTFDVNDHFVPEHILSVMQERPELFEELPPIPEAAQITPDYVFDRAQAQEACPAS